MNRLLRDPLFHFALAGAALFALYSRENPGRVASGPSKAGAEVRIGASELDWLEQTWTRQWRRPPTADEMRGLVTELIREEVLSREARELGLDENDTIIRRRLAQKLEFMVQDTARLADPADDDLRKFYASHAGDFAEPRRISFEQVLFSGSRRTDPDSDARRALASLAAGETDAADLGDPSLLARTFSDSDRHAIESQLGPAFADAIVNVATGAWTGPVESSFGAHLVRVTSIVPARARSFDDARSDVAAAWREAQQRTIDAQFFEDLLARHPIVVDEIARPLVAGIDGARLRDADGSIEESAR